MMREVDDRRGLGCIGHRVVGQLRGPAEFMAMDAAHARLWPVDGESGDAVPNCDRFLGGRSGRSDVALPGRTIRMRYNSVHGYHFFGRCSRKSLEDRGVRNDYS